jgi:hypothetical protein
MLLPSSKATLVVSTILPSHFSLSVRLIFLQDALVNLAIIIDLLDYLNLGTLFLLELVLQKRVKFLSHAKDLGL